VHARGLIFHFGDGSGQPRHRERITLKCRVRERLDKVRLEDIEIKGSG